MMDMIILTWIWKYLAIGFIWLLICDLYLAKFPTNGARMRYFLLWPITLGAFIIGVINAMSEQQDEEM